MSDTQTAGPEPEPNSTLDVLIVGGGFSGIEQLHNCRKLGYSVKIFEAGNALGGIWYWNCYPGARTDSRVPEYGFSSEELWRDWKWSERYPGWEEMRRYFEFVDKKLGLKKDVYFNKRVVSAMFDASVDRWVVSTQDGTVVKPRFLVLAVGFAAKPYIPDFAGLDRFEGICHHTALWPQGGVDMKGKRVGVIGTGASGVQVIQEVGPVVEHLTVFQRTPNFALAMQQENLDDASDVKLKKMAPAILRRRRQTTFGHPYAFYPKSVFAATPEERFLYWEEQWAQGGFHFIVGNYNDVFANEDANDAVYAFWREKVKQRVTDPLTFETLAPAIPPHPFGAKRTCLEQRYYEVFNQSNVDLVDIKKMPIREFTKKGVVMNDGSERELDVIVLATGFDSLTGGLTQIDIRGVDGVGIAEKWGKGVFTQLGMTMKGFPNMFFMYGPQAPTAFSNGPTLIEIQSDWITNCISHMMKNNITRIEATREAEEKWRSLVLEFDSKALMKKTMSWYNGGNIPGKVVEQLNFLGGVDTYDGLCVEIARNGYEGFVLSRRD